MSDLQFNGYMEIGEVNLHLLTEIREFFQVYKRLEPEKWVKFKALKGVDEAKNAVSDAIELYNKFKPSG